MRIRGCADKIVGVVVVIFIRLHDWNELEKNQGVGVECFDRNGCDPGNALLLLCLTLESLIWDYDADIYFLFRIAAFSFSRLVVVEAVPVSAFIFDQLE